MRKFLEKVSKSYQLEPRPNRDVENSFRAYETSFETERLESERNREIYCELIDFGRKKNLAKHSDIKTTKVDTDKSAVEVGESDEHVVVETADVDKKKWWTGFFLDETNRVKTLVEIAAIAIAAEFKEGAVDAKVQCQDAVDFGLHADISLPIQNLLKLDNDSFWKRFVEVSTQESYKFQVLLRCTLLKNWRQLGLESKFSELIENLLEKDFYVPSTQLYLIELIGKLGEEIENISINHLKPRKTVNKNPLFPQTRIVNFSSDECLHGPLDCLQHLQRTKNFSIDFNPGNLKTKYERRFMKIATEDIENLGKSLEYFKKLECFKIRCDLKQPEKVHKILSLLQSMKHLKKIDLSFCQISTEKSAEHFKSFLSINESLESLQLKGNKLGRIFCKLFAQGIENFKGKLKFLGLSHTSTLGNGLCSIIESIRKKNCVDHLEIFSCESEFHENSAECFYEIIQMIEVQGGVKVLNMNLNYIETFEIKEELIRALNKNFHLNELNCTDCGFSSEEMVKIKVLLCRNNYFKENPILKKPTFTLEDELEIEKFLKRTKHPLLIKHSNVLTE